ncbi:MAG: O-antigen ligase family protein [Candidatus Omnitrophica bacterium]|nr:O-antigen ligase family protein [Candidatus Omnitrophota bacterium]
MDFKKIRNSILYFLIFIRPFISSQAFPELEKYFLVVLVLLTLAFLKEIRYQNNPFILDIALSLYTLGGIFSIIFSTHRINSLYSFPLYFTGLLFFSIILTLNSEEIKRILKIMLISGTLISLYGIYQFFLGFSQTAEYILKTNPHFFTNHLIRNYLLSKRVFSTFFSPNMLAGYLIMLIPLSIGIREKKKLFYYLFTGILVFVLFLTQSLGGIFSAIFSFITLFLVLRPKKIPQKYLFSGLIIILLLTLPIFLWRADRIFNLENPHNSILQRLNFLRLSFKIIKNNFLLGVGLGNFGNFYLRYSGLKDIRTNYAHNFILQTQAEMGILGLLSIALIIFIFYKDILSTRKNFSSLRFSLLWAGTSFLIHNLIDISFFIPEIAVFFWIIWAGFKNLSQERFPP